MGDIPAAINIKIARQTMQLSNRSWSSSWLRLTYVYSTSVRLYGITWLPGSLAMWKCGGMCASVCWCAWFGRNKQTDGEVEREDYFLSRWETGNIGEGESVRFLFAFTFERPWEIWQRQQLKKRASAALDPTPKWRCGGCPAFRCCWC